jgi:hypothetical protein
MARDNLGWFGTNRGALTTARELKSSTLKLYEPTLLLADPKENRAKEFGEVVLRKQFPTLTLTPKPLVVRVQDALPVHRDLSSVLVTVDTSEDTLAALNTLGDSQRMTFQIVGRGPGGVSGTRIGLQGTLSPGDQSTKRSVSLLLQALAEMSKRASSRELTGPDPVSLVVLEPLRKSVSRLSALHIGEKEREPRDLTGSPLSVTFGQTLHPLIAVAGRPQEKFSQQQALALETSALIPGGQSSRMVVVALVSPEAVHFMRVALASSGKRVVAGVCSFVRPVERAASTAPALFTD